MVARGKRAAEARRPWLSKIIEESTESAKYRQHLFRSFRASGSLTVLSRGDAPRFARRLPLAFIFRAVGARRFPGFHISRRWRSG